MRFFPCLDGTWRIVDRGVPQHLDPIIDGLDCYVFQRRDPDGRSMSQWHVIPVEKFWGRSAA